MCPWDEGFWGSEFIRILRLGYRSLEALVYTSTLSLGGSPGFDPALSGRFLGVWGLSRNHNVGA